jgi:putative transposase
MGDAGTHDYLRRLPVAAYKGTAAVHWSMTIEGRRTGWLDAVHHCQFRELLAHTMGRFELACPAYCLMPDHGHALWIGIGARADQSLAARFLRRHWNRLLRVRSYELQLQGFDHVLSSTERERNAFGAIAYYILENPARAGLVESWRDYPYSGAVILGRPELDSRAEDFWERFWRFWNFAVDDEASSRVETTGG